MNEVFVPLDHPGVGPDLPDLNDGKVAPGAARPLRCIYYIRRGDVAALPVISVRFPVGRTTRENELYPIPR